MQTVKDIPRLDTCTSPQFFAQATDVSDEHSHSHDDKSLGVVFKTRRGTTSFHE